MKLQYDFQLIHNALIMVLPKELLFVQELLVTDINYFICKEYLKLFEDVLDAKEAKTEEISGNAHTLVIRKEKTEVINNIFEEKFEIDTTLLQQIIKMHYASSSFFLFNQLTAKLFQENTDGDNLNALNHKIVSMLCDILNDEQKSEKLFEAAKSSEYAMEFFAELLRNRANSKDI